MAADPWSMDYGMVHTGRKRNSRLWGNRQLRQLSRVQSGYRESRTDLNLLVRCPSIPTAVWQNWHVGDFFSLPKTPKMHKPTWCRIETLCSMHVYGMEAERLLLSSSQLTQFARTPEWTVGSFPGFCSVSSTGKAFPANDSFGIAVMV